MKEPVDFRAKYFSVRPGIEMRKASALDAIQTVTRAFDGVTLGNGMGLRESNVMDARGGYHSEEDRISDRDRDEVHDWSRISDVDIESNPYGLCFMDNDGLRFHLPAYMCFALRRHEDSTSCSADHAAFRLCDPVCFDRLRDSLTDPQIGAIVEFLVAYGENQKEDWEDVDSQVAAAIRMWQGDVEAANQLRRVIDENSNFQSKLRSHIRAAWLKETWWDILKLLVPIVLFGVLLYRLLTMQNGAWWWFTFGAVVSLVLAACLIIYQDWDELSSSGKDR